MTFDLPDHLEALERELLNPLTRRNRDRLEACLSPEFREFGSSGRIFDRDAILSELSSEIPSTFLLFDFVCQQLTATVALVTYRAERYSEGENRPQSSLRSSLWIMRQEYWQMIFHQGTRMPKTDVSANR